MEFFDWIRSHESIVLTLYAIILFFLLTPGIIVRLPPGGSKMMVAITHAIIFGLLWHFTSHYAFSLVHY